MKPSFNTHCLKPKTLKLAAKRLFKLQQSQCVITDKVRKRNLYWHIFNHVAELSDKSYQRALHEHMSANY